MHPLDDTIAAIASPPGGAAVGIVRISGPAAWPVVGQCVQTEDRIETATIHRPAVTTGNFLADGIASPLACEIYLWPEGRSYTGQSVAEIHTLGSPPLLQATLQTLCRAGARLAQPGEFTLRAFLSGRIDLTQAEAVLGVIDAADPKQLDVALAQLAGGLARPLQDLRDRLIDLLALLEAGFDFADEDLPFVAADDLQRQLQEAAELVDELARQTDTRGHGDGAIRAVLAGRPNVGKSSLFNALIGTAGALVSPRPGTTRDYLTAELDLDGVRCQLIDTAGMATTDNEPCPIQHAAQQTTAEQRRQAHLEVHCLDCTRADVEQQHEQLARADAGPAIVVLTKVDLPRETGCPQGAIATSSVTGAGIDALRAELRRAVLSADATGGDAVAGTVVRCRESLRLAAECLGRCLRLLDDGGGEELIAAELRVALDELGKVAGAVYTDDVLDRVFSRFCIGK